MEHRWKRRKRKKREVDLSEGLVLDAARHAEGKRGGWFDKLTRAQRDVGRGGLEASRCSASDDGGLLPDRVGRGMKETPPADPRRRTKASASAFSPCSSLETRSPPIPPRRRLSIVNVFARARVCVCASARLGI